VIECRKCTAGTCTHGAQCPMMIRWYDDPWDGTFWRRCECTAWIHAAVYPVTVTRVAEGGLSGSRLDHLGLWPVHSTTAGGGT
jgi:hypothetical protein